MAQYTLDISPVPDYASSRFVISDSNALAHDWLTRWPDWPTNSLYLQGEKGSGKTHLAHIWQEKSQAYRLAVDSDILPQGAVLVEDIEGWKNQAALFHLFNHCKSEGLPLLLSSQYLPSALPFALPDLLSRLKAMTCVTIQAPDDALMEAVLSKQLADLQLKIDPALMEYMLPRMERSLDTLSGVVRRLDAASLEAARTLTIPFIRQTLGW